MRLTIVAKLLFFMVFTLLPLTVAVCVVDGPICNPLETVTAGATLLH